jgi:type II secretory pathway pseudopilin PulG
MKRDPNDLIGKIAAACLLVIIVVTIVSGLLLTASQRAIDEAALQQKAVACARAPQMCVAVQASR